MCAQKFLTDVENGVVPVNSHDQLLRIAWIYMDEPLWNGQGVFDVIEKLHTHGWSFGEGELRFNRTLDMFYLAQIAAALYLTVHRSSDPIDGLFETLDGFNTFYTEHHALLHPSVWREYYSEPFLKQKTTARFYRLPDLQDLPDSNHPLDIPIRERPHVGGSPHVTKLPRWAHNVARTYLRQPLLPLATLTDIALSTLETTIIRQRKAHPSVRPYSETQARFWLEYMVAPYLKARTRTEVPSPTRWNENGFGILAAQGFHDMYEWERKYSVQLWEASWEQKGVVEPDVEDGVWKSEIIFCGHPDGGISSYAWWRGWDGELGSEEEIEFLAAVAVEETVGVEHLDKLDFAVRSHILLGVMRAAVKTGREREDLLQELEMGMVQSGRIKERARLWLREALGVVKPYVRLWEGVWPDAKERRKMLQQILVENGQLLARWKASPHLKEFSFELGPPVYHR
ncbi:hypothetical protein P170DRAFT_352846 [Aspergillus steynii IBT 23096]|uniref:Rta1 domain protein n=1 Tax=Aspergillus steynii IBT 23096 TaxID=1392250 RepID=A0A2I2GHM1_9EURO|nr:uncharacterized protein P170DRAFT_352846 [Aspergillus steynii IBT 23096]PLB52364.1 hypothetical protein P170DRAFT_352846 [Aspergillus steynii IBT 23096]